MSAPAKELRIGGEYVVEIRRHQSKPNLVACRVLGGAELIMHGEQLADLIRADWATDADTDPYEKEPETDRKREIPMAMYVAVGFMTFLLVATCGLAWAIRVGLI